MICQMRCVLFVHKQRDIEKKRNEPIKKNNIKMLVLFDIKKNAFNWLVSLKNYFSSNSRVASFCLIAP